MNTIIALCLALALVPATAVFAVDTDAVLGGAVGGGVGAAVGSELGGRSGAVLGGAIGAAAGTAVMTDDKEVSSPPPKRVIQVNRYPRREYIYMLAPPPPRVIYVGEPSYRHIPPGHAKHWRKKKYKFK